ncbi:GNAT family N-acetyltransferase [Thermoactinospora rubra]|uniref:GNAT family N-acetyltransferase n=1 Tax=Thermoactinospora rubra TaxID=1088767 RepID=UPI000A1015AA|nr:GNAT family N-acetyltransferase [Thermoactinospora rubra]
MLFRPTVGADLDRLLAVAVDEPVSWADSARIRRESALGSYRPEWMWIAEDDGGIRARAVFWGLASREVPESMDCLWVDPSVPDRVGLASALLAAAFEEFGTKPEYHLFLPNGWRERPEAAAAVAWRAGAVSRLGMTHELERYRYEWTPRAGVPAPSARLVFRPEPDDEVVVDAFRRVAEGTLDSYTRRALAVMDPVAQAREDVEDYKSMRGERDWWRLAFTPGGELVGVAVPSANNSGPVVGYLGVVPEHRGKGYVVDLLNEITRFHAGRGAEVVRADTDFGNTPMARAFERAGYVNTSVRLVLSAEE